MKKDNNTAIDLAKCYVKLMKDENLNRKELSIKLGVSYDKIKALVSLLKLDDEILTGIKYNLITIHHGKQLLRIDNSDKRQLLYRFIIVQNYSARDIKKIVDDILRAKRELSKKKHQTYVFNGDLKCRKSNKTIKKTNNI